MRYEEQSLRDRLPNAPEAELDLLKRMFEFSPVSRITALAALEHDYLDQFRDPHSEFASSVPLTLPFDDSYCHSITGGC
jgi:serine/threonine protein kinase